MMWLIGAAIGALAAEVLNFLDRRTPGPRDRAQQRGGTGHFLVLIGPDRCRCGNEWPCLDSVAADRRSRV